MMRAQIDNRRSDERAPLVVQIVRQYTPSRGGLEDVVANLSRSLLAKGWRVRVVTLDRLFRDPDNTLSPRDIIDGVDVVRIPWRGSSRYPIAPSVFSHVRDADLVHVHGIDFFYDALAWTRVLHGKPLVATTHGGFFHTHNHALLKKIWFQTATRLSGLAYDAVICCSQSDRDRFLPITGSRTRLIENGVDIGKFAGLSSTVPVRRLVTIGRFSVNKRLERLLDMLVQLRSSVPDWRLDIIGSPSDLSSRDLEREIATRRLGGAVSLHVGVTDDEVRKVLGECSVFVSASDYEGFGLVAVEAMSAGLLPVLHDNAAYRVLADRHAGIGLTDFAHPQVAAAKVEQAFAMLLDKPAMREEMMLAASQHDWGGVCDRHIDLYRHILSGRRSGRAG
ncbi:glycosyltransferase family 4 protein [Rhizobium sp. AAP43]|uniref:glycosyltransferase family 4 protein n=1 Tax=Rhizobium sp. AAP43 TaxID=1523420 RepID=UPI0006B8DB16|nr:glycosyltransferase family 4 protein [Rhizobium sp. AAP43]KPF41202.1 glycosyl transferase family 1 [Rhizobium sp. AAP43]